MANETIRRDVNYITLLGAITNTVAQDIVQLRVDSITNRLLVDSLTTQAGYEAVGDGTATVTTAGTRVQLSATSAACKRVFIQAHESNTGTIVVGSITVVAALAGRSGFALFSAQGEWFNVNNLNLLYVDSTVSLDKIHYYYEK